MDIITKQVFFFFDDSGVLHKNEQSGYFVYAGYVFSSRDDLDSAKREYIHANQEIKKATGLSGELKAARLKAKHKRSLFNSVKKYESLSAVVNISRLYDHILAEKKSICRYKDYILKLCIKNKLLELISKGVLNDSDDVDIFVYIDEQLTATNGYYDLRDSIREELQHGIANWDYGVIHPKVFNGTVKVFIEYCESKNNYLIQASDIIANRIWTSYRINNPQLRQIPNHKALTFP